MVLCERRSLLGFWKRVGPPCQVHDICLRGLKLRNRGKRLRPGTTLRLTIFLTPNVSIRVKGRTVWDDEAAATHGRLCGVEFTDFCGRAWGVLCNAYARYRGGQNAADDGNCREFDIAGLLERVPGRPTALAS